MKAVVPALTNGGCKRFIAFPAMTAMIHLPSLSPTLERYEDEACAADDEPLLYRESHGRQDEDGVANGRDANRKNRRP